MPPVEPMLAKAVDEIPAGMQYEAKWDGFRSIVFRDGAEVELASRTGKSLTRYFPELVTALRAELPQRCVLDGEIVLAHDGRLHFEELQERIHPAASRVRTLAERTPASFVAFDLLALGDVLLAEQPLSARREALVAALAAARPPVHTAPATTDRELARSWFTRFEGAGLDGIVAKPLDQPYRPGVRSMFKIKHGRTADCVVAGYRDHKDGSGAGSLLLGLYDAAGVLQHVGVCSSFTAARRRELAEELAPLRMADPGGHPWAAWSRIPRTRAPGCPARRAAGAAARTPPGCHCAPNGSARSATTTWRAAASGIPPVSSAGGPTAPRKAATTGNWRSRSATTWPNCSPPATPRRLIARDLAPSLQGVARPMR